MDGFLHRVRRLVACALLSGAGTAAAAPASVAFYYGDDVPVDALAQFDWVVVETAHVDDRELTEMRRHCAEVFGYVSVGEVERWRGRPEGVPDAAILGENKSWNNEIADLTHPAWRTHLMEHRIAPLWESGYRRRLCVQPADPGLPVLAGEGDRRNRGLYSGWWNFSSSNCACWTIR